MPRKARLSHLSSTGQARMVDVAGKPATDRSATAEAFVEVGPTIAGLLASPAGMPKGDALGVARLAGILAAKRTAELIPLCHPLPLDHIDVQATLDGPRVRIVAEASCRGPTGVEMEAMTAAAVAALTVYDMVKSAGKGVTIGPIRLLAKDGGKSGRWRRRET